MSTFKKPALIAGSLLLVFSLIFLAGGNLTFAEDNDFDELDTLSCKVEGTMEGDPAEFWYRIKDIGTDDEAFRLDATNLESEKTMGIIINQAEGSSFYKELGAGSWMSVPLSMVEPYWQMYRERHITAIGGADVWRKWAKADKDEYKAEVVIEGEKETVRLYDIKVDEPINDSVFSP